MKKKSASRSAFFNPRFLISFAFCAIGVFLALLAFALYPGGNARAAQSSRHDQSAAQVQELAQGSVGESAPDNHGGTSGNERAPSTNFRFGRAVYLLTAAELATDGFLSGTAPTSIGWTYETAGIAGSAPLTVYMENTADVTNLKSASWATAINSMTVVHNATTALPSVRGPFDITLSGGASFTYTGGGLYIAFDWGQYNGIISTKAAISCNTALANGLLGAQSSAAAPATLTASNFRPVTRLNAPAGGVTVSLPIANFDTSVPINTQIIQPVTTTQIDASLNYVGFQGDFTFNETVCTFPAPFVQAAGLTGGGNWNVTANVLPGSGPIRILRVSAFAQDFVPLNGSGVLYNLRMLRVSSTPGANTPLTWQPDPDNFIFIDGDLNSIVPAQNNGSITVTGLGNANTFAYPVAYTDRHRDGHGNSHRNSHRDSDGNSDSDGQPPQPQPRLPLPPRLRLRRQRGAMQHGVLGKLRQRRCASPARGLGGIQCNRSRAALAHLDHHA